jgi:ABC-type sugar transport system substrate-binding protein
MSNDSNLSGGTIPLSDPRYVGRCLDRLNTRGVSRRDFLALATAGTVAATTAATLGYSSTAVASSSGKLAYLGWSSRVEYIIQASKATKAAAADLGLSYTYLDGQADAQRQLSQADEQAVAGVNGIILHAPDGSAIRRIAELSSQNQVYFSNVWATQPWFTPFDVSDYYTLYAVPEELTAEAGVTRELLKAVVAKFGGGNIIGVTGVPGFSTDAVRSRGRDSVFKEFPTTKLVGQLPGNFNREDSLKATDALLSRYKNVVGVVAQNDDVAQGVIAALRGAGLRPGIDVLVVGADGTSEGARAIKQGQQVATSANIPAYQAALFTTRLYDVLNGWRPRASERMLYWRSIVTTQANVDPYLARYVDNGDVQPFDYRLMSKVLHPNDWDPQGDLYPLDIDEEWTGFPKPNGWTYPKEYLAAKHSGEWEAVRAEYAAHYKIKFFDRSPNRPV